MPRNRKKNREISVCAPDYIPKRAPILKDTTGTEALDVFTVAENFGRFFSFVMVPVGILVAIIAASSILTSFNIFWNPLFLGVLGSVGVLNLFCGLLLLSKK